MPLWHAASGPLPGTVFPCYVHRAIFTRGDIRIKVPRRIDLSHIQGYSTPVMTAIMGMGNEDLHTLLVWLLHAPGRNVEAVGKLAFGTRVNRKPGIIEASEGAAEGKRQPLALFSRPLVDFWTRTKPKPIP